MQVHSPLLCQLCCACTFKCQMFCTWGMAQYGVYCRQQQDTARAQLLTLSVLLLRRRLLVSNHTLLILLGSLSSTAVVVMVVA